MLLEILRSIDVEDWKSRRAEIADRFEVDEKLVQEKYELFLQFREDLSSRSNPSAQIYGYAVCIASAILTGAIAALLTWSVVNLLPGDSNIAEFTAIVIGGTSAFAAYSKLREVHYSSCFR